jgi:hypothetical protein
VVNRAQNGEVSVEARIPPFVLVATSCNAGCLISIQCKESSCSAIGSVTEEVIL